MQKSTIVATIVSFLFIQAMCVADSNEPNANNFRRGPRARGFYQSERVLINWHDGIEQMVVSPRLSPDANSVWLFPVKAKSQQIKFALTKEFPAIFGSDSRQQAADKVRNVSYAMIMTQLWTIPIYFFGEESFDSSFRGGGGPGIMGSGDANGVHTELLNAQSPSEMARQLGERGKTIHETDLAGYAKYFNNEYSILALWREGNEPNITQGDFRRAYRRRPSIYVEFPSDKPFYPIISKGPRYGRLWLTLMGYWQIAEQEQSRAFQCDQLVSTDANIPVAFKASLPQTNIPFTTFSIMGTDNQIPYELTFVPGRVTGMTYADTIAKMSYPAFIALGIIALAVISYLSAGVSGLIAFKKWRGFAESGLLNLLSIVALGIAMNYKQGGVAEVFRQNKPKARIFLVLFSIFVVLLASALYAILKMPLNVQ